MTEFKLEVKGIKELSRSLKKVDADAPKAMKGALNGVSTLIIGKAKPLIPKRSGRAAGSLRASSTRTEVKIRVGGSKAPYYPWLDFGGRTGIRGSVVRPFFKEGRYLYPTLSANSAEIAALLEGSLAEVIKSAGLDVD